MTFFFVGERGGGWWNNFYIIYNKLSLVVHPWEPMHYLLHHNIRTWKCRESLLAGPVVWTRTFISPMANMNPIDVLLLIVSQSLFLNFPVGGVGTRPLEPILWGTPCFFHNCYEFDRNYRSSWHWAEKNIAKFNVNSLLGWTYTETNTREYILL